MPPVYLQQPPRIPQGVSYRGRMPEMVVQDDFRKVGGISSEIFHQIQAVENDFDQAAYYDSVEKRGEMIIRLIDPRILGRAGEEAYRKYRYTCGPSDGQNVQFIEIIKRPGQTLGLYIREGDGYTRRTGVFISRIALECAVYNSGLLKVGDEILAVNLVDVSRMSLDDVVIIMSIPRRLVLTIRPRSIRQRIYDQTTGTLRKSLEDFRSPPVVVLKNQVDIDDEPLIGEEREIGSQWDNENGELMYARLKGLPEDMPPIAVPLDSSQYDQSHYYSPRGTLPMREPIQARDDPWLVQREDPYASVMQRRGLQRQYPRTLENLAGQVHQFYSDYSSDVPLSSSARFASPMHLANASIHRPPSAGGVPRYWEDQSYPLVGSLNRGHQRRFRRDNYQQMPLTMSDDFLDRYMNRPLSRSQMRTPTLASSYSRLTPMQDMARRRQRRYTESDSSVHALNALLRRRAYLDGSASDTEVSSSPKPSHYAALRSGQRSLGPYSRLLQGARDDFQLRSSSLPRTRPSSSSGYRSSYSKSLPRKSQRQSVRFDQSFGYDDDSDGAVSAPELPPSRSRRLGKMLRKFEIFVREIFTNFVHFILSSSFILFSFIWLNATSGSIMFYFQVIFI